MINFVIKIHLSDINQLTSLVTSKNFCFIYIYFIKLCYTHKNIFTMSYTFYISYL